MRVVVVAGSGVAIAARDRFRALECIHDHRHRSI